MKKLTGIILAAIVFTLVFCVSAFALDSAPGIYGLNSIDGVTLTPQRSDGTAVTSTTKEINSASEDFYPAAEKIEVNFSSANSGNFYLIIAQSAAAAPTAENVVYINQATATGSSLTFNVYPSSLEAGKTYYIYLSSNTTGGERTQIGSFKYYLPYRLGDVDQDGNLNSYDASLILQALVGQYSYVGNGELAADVDENGTINAFDASLILQHLVGTYTIPGWD